MGAKIPFSRKVQFSIQIPKEVMGILTLLGSLSVKSSLLCVKFPPVHLSPGIWVRACKEREEVAGRDARHLVNCKNSSNKFTLDIFFFLNNIKVNFKENRWFWKNNNSVFMATEKLYFPDGLAQTQAESARFNSLFIFIVLSLSSGVLFLQNSPSFKKSKAWKSALQGWFYDRWHW